VEAPEVERGGGQNGYQLQSKHFLGKLTDFIVD
jgi:hypothetical protein